MKTCTSSLRAACLLAAASGALAQTPTPWSFQRPERPPLPAPADPGWCRRPLDRFVLARLEAEGLAPSPEAGRVELLRRLALDLTGLPPTPAEVDAFLADDRPDAYERQVERLLASPHHGERMALAWLDLARYSDTNGLRVLRALLADERARAGVSVEGAFDGVELCGSRSRDAELDAWTGVATVLLNLEETITRG